MANDPIRRVLRWKRLEIGLTHDPLMGDTRHGRKVVAGYGHIRGSYGDAEDGMSLDVYIGPDLGSDRIFRVAQVDEAGALDERKYILGCWSAAEARALYLAHMPESFFGGIEPVEFSALKRYQKPLEKSAGDGELAELAELWVLSPKERLEAALGRASLLVLGPTIPPIHQVLFDA